MEWYQYLAAFFAGTFISNFVPHYVHGVSGNKFPSPFTQPMGKALSSAPVNMLWALANLVIAYLLFIASNASRANTASLLVIFAGFSIMSIRASIGFQKKHKE